MTRSGEQHLTATRDDLACPACSYPLRGLEGDVVTCPECGKGIDVAALVTQQWRKPWYRAPGFDLLTAPVAILFVGLMATFLVFVAREGATSQSPGVVTGIVAVILWFASFSLVRARFGDCWSLLYAMLGHVILVAYGVGIIGGIIMVARAISDLANGNAAGMVSAVFAVALFGLVYAGRRGERFMAAYCIRRHLARAAVVEE